jgi:cytochrome c-type biogenesis protein CcmH
MRRARTLAALAVALALTGLAGAPTIAAAATQDYDSVVNQFMCVSCHEPLAQVNSPQAISEKQTLQGLIARGLTLNQIKAAMVGQYGEQVLARPPASGFNLTVYILPPAVFLGGLALLAYTLPKWRARSRATKPLAAASPLPPEEASRLDDELQHFI